MDQPRLGLTSLVWNFDIEQIEVLFPGDVQAEECSAVGARKLAELQFLMQANERASGVRRNNGPRGMMLPVLGCRTQDVPAFAAPDPVVRPLSDEFDRITQQ